MRVKSLSELANALELRAKAVPVAPTVPVSPPVEAAPGTPGEPTRSYKRPGPGILTVSEMLTMQDRLKARYYEVSVTEKPKEGDPEKVYTGARFVPPTRRGEGSKKMWSLS